MKRFNPIFTKLSKRNKRYLFLSTLCVVGYVWVVRLLLNPVRGSHYGVCFSKSVYGVSCPACGTTRSLLLVLKGQLWDALYMNPIGYLAFFFLIFVPLGIIYDLVFQRSYVNKLYDFLETQLKKPRVFILFVILIVANWIWNFLKGN